MRYLIALLTLSLGVASYQGTNPSDHATQTGKATEKGKAEIKPLAPVPDSAGAAVSKPEESSKQQRTDDSNNVIPHWVSYLNAVSTAVVALFTVLMWRVYRSVLHATKITERAWLVSDIGSIEKTPAEETHQVIVQLRNNGKTPAWVTAAGSNGWWVDDKHPLPKTPKYDLMGPFTKEGQLLPPTAWLSQGFPLQKTQIDRAVRKEAVLYIFGFIEYRDIFGNQHMTRYCYQAKPALDLNHSNPLDFYFDSPAEGYLKAT
jgi:hypothetical protein